MAGFCIQPAPLFAQDQDTGKTDTKNADAVPHAANEKPAATKQVQKENQPGGVSRSDKTDGKIDAGKTAGVNRPTDVIKQKSEVAKQSDKQTNQGRSQQKQSATAIVQGTQANHYNNQWVAASTHSDWDVNANHNWNNHEYRYYDGGWLIIDTSESPDYYQSDSLVIRVKQSLASQGYYNGHLSATVGPRTRQAISHYESDKGLQVNGEIDATLVASLGLE